MKTDNQLFKHDFFLVTDDKLVQIYKDEYLESLSIETIQFLVDLIVKKKTWFLDSQATDFVEWAMQTIQSKKVALSEETLTVEQLEIFGIPSGQCDHFGNDLY